ncbi:MAG: phosphatidate cytidylyltransferase [Sphingobacteriales bacterium]|nr:MAG: phosphatidate cytidylyltransferase [Sphingobacteriales bacterium]
MMLADWLILFKLSFAFLALFIVAELLYAKAKLAAETTRKIVHIGTGVLTLLFPIYLQHLWQVILLCSLFFILLWCSIRFGLLPSINAIERKSYGSLLYPVIVALVFTFYTYMSFQPLPFSKLLYFYLPVLLMAICDPIAAYAGHYFQKKYQFTAKKTWGGTLAFLVAAFLLSLLMFGYFNLTVAYPAIVLYALATAILTATAERLSSKGWDNFTIPFITAMFLAFISTV